MKEYYYKGISCEDGYPIFFVSKEKIDLTNPETALYSDVLRFDIAWAEDDIEGIEKAKKEGWYSPDMLRDRWSGDYCGDWTHCIVGWKQGLGPIVEVNGRELDFPVSKKREWVY